MANVNISETIDPNDAKKQSLEALNALMDVLEAANLPPHDQTLKDKLELGKSFCMVLIMQLTDPAKLDQVLVELKRKEALKNLERAGQENRAVERLKKQFDIE